MCAQHVSGCVCVCAHTVAAAQSFGVLNGDLPGPETTAQALVIKVLRAQKFAA